MRESDLLEDIGHASLDGDEGVSYDAGVSGIDQNSHLVGAAAVDLLMEHFSGGSVEFLRHRCG